MDSVVRARFFQVENFTAGEAPLYDCLQQLAARPDVDQYQEFYGGIRIRLERFFEVDRDDNADYVEGEFVRQQTENIPPIALQSAPLQGNANPLGHRCAFLYYMQRETLLLESRREAVTPSRIHGFIRARLNPHNGFSILPMLSSSAMARLQNGTPRKVRLRVANPAHMNVVEGHDIGIEENLARFQNMFEGPTIEVSSSWPRGNKNGVLNRKNLADLLRWVVGNRDHVEKLDIKILEESDPIDVLSEQIKDSETLSLDNLNVDTNYNTRREFLRRTFAKARPMIEELY